MWGRLQPGFSLRRGFSPPATGFIRASPAGLATTRTKFSDLRLGLEQRRVYPAESGALRILPLHDDVERLRGRRKRSLEFGAVLLHKSPAEWRRSWLQFETPPSPPGPTRTPPRFAPRLTAELTSRSERAPLHLWPGPPPRSTRFPKASRARL